MKRNLKSVSAFTETTPFTTGQIRFWIFDAERNGLANHGAIVRVGRRVYIDVEGFERWIDAQQAAGVSA